MNKDLANRVVVTAGLAPVVIASDTDTVTLVVETQAFQSCVFALTTGLVTAGDITISKVEEADDLAFTTNVVEIPDSRYWDTPVTLDTAVTTDYIGIDVQKCFARVTLTTANSANLLASGIFILGHESVQDYLKAPASSPV